MSSRIGLSAPGLHAQRGRDRFRRGRACQRTRRARRLREDDSRGAVGAVGGESVDGGGQGAEHRGRKIRRRHSQHRGQDGTNRAARSAGAALLLHCRDNLRGKRRRCGIRAIAIESGDRFSVIMGAWRGAPVVRLHGWRCLLRMDGRPAVMVIGPAKRHDRGRSTLRRYRHHQQPDQDRSDQQTHLATVQQPVHRWRQNWPRRPAVQCMRARPSPRDRLVTSAIDQQPDRTQ